MIELLELVDLLTSSRMNESEIFGVDPELKGMPKYILYRGIRDGTVQNDSAGSLLVYGESMPSSKFYNLKRRLFEELAGVCASIQGANAVTSKHLREQIKTHRHLGNAKALLLRGAPFASKLLAQDVLRIAREYELAEIEQDALFFLARSEAKTGNTQSHTKLREQHAEAKLRSDYEQEADLMMQEIAVLVAEASTYYAEGTLAKFDEYSNRIDVIKKKCPTQEISLFDCRIRAYNHIVHNRYKQAIEACEEAILLLTVNVKSIRKNRIREFALIALQSAVRSKHFDIAQRLIKSYGTTFLAGSRNWAIMKEFELFTYLHTSQFLKAAVLMNSIRYSYYFRKFSPAQREQWRLIQFFVAYFHESGWTTYPESVVPKITNGIYERGFVVKLRTKFPLSSHDPKGDGALIIILQLLYSLQQENLEAIENVIGPAILHHRNRYLEKDTRQWALFTLMYLHSRNTSNTTAVRKWMDTAENILFRGEGMKVTDVDPVEIFPYDTLWVHIKERFEQLSSKRLEENAVMA